MKPLFTLFLSSLLWAGVLSVHADTGSAETGNVTVDTRSDIADLSALSLSTGTLSPVFASGTLGYTASVANSASAITVTPTKADVDASIQVRINGGSYAAVTSGSPSGSLALNVGTNTVEILVTAQDQSTKKTYTVTVTRDKAAQTITFANPGNQLATATVTLSATGGASGNSVTFAVSTGPAAISGGNVLSFTGAGSVTITASQAGNANYHAAPDVSQTFTVSKAPQTITFASPPNRSATESQTLSGSSSSGLPVVFDVGGPVTGAPLSNLANGSTLTFTGPGTVTVTAKQTGSALYAAASDVTKTFTVTATSATVTLGNLTHTYDGNAKAATATTTPSGLPVTISYNPASPKNAGTYAVTASITDARYSGSATGTLTINKASQVITFASPGNKEATDTVTLSATGGASGKPVTFSATGPAMISGGNVLSFTGPGSVTITASQAGDANYDAAPSVSHTITVTATSATVTLDNLTHTYDGSAKAATATTTPSGLPVSISYNPASPKDAGTYTVTATITDARYSGSATGTLTINKASQAITFASPGNKEATATVTLSATGGASGKPVTFSATGPATISGGNVLSFTGPGSVTITASQAGDANYNAAPNVSHTITVTATAATVTLGNLTHTYDGNAKAATATTTPSGLPVTISYNPASPKDAGSYAVTASITDARYSGSATGTLTINKASQAITFASPGNKEATETVTLSATGGASGKPVTFSATGPATISGGNVLSFTGPGSVTITASQAGDANYNAAPNVSHTITVTATSATFTLSRLHQVADGTDREVTVVSDPVDLDIEVLYDGSSPPPTVPGSYAVEVSSADARYEGSASGTLIVDDPARSVVVAGGMLSAQSALGAQEVPTFRIGAYEITGSQWATVVTWAEANAGYDFDGAGTAAAGDHPVTDVSWADAAKWSNARTEWENAMLGRSLAPAYYLNGAVFKTGTPASPADLECDFGSSGYRLPTAAEWEYAARGGNSGTPSTYPGGETLDELGWYDANSNASTQAAGDKAANELDLYDLAGNAAEWTWDGPDSSSRYLRGGDWSSAASASELSTLTSETAITGSDRSGFRVANSISLALTAALDHPDLAWDSGGNEVWFAQTASTHDNEDAAESPSLAQGQSSWMGTQVEGPGNLSFQWKTEGTANDDVLTLLIDNVPVLTRSGTEDWEEQLVEIESGPHTIAWVFTRGSASGPARAWVDEVGYDSAELPKVITNPATDITRSESALGGEITDDGGRAITERGVVYGLTPDPTVGSDTVLTDPASGVGAFTITASSLSEGSTYYVRAYATNNLGTSYGASVNFTTHTGVNFVGGVDSYTREILSDGTHVYHFTLNDPRFVSLNTTGGAPLRAELLDSEGKVIARFDQDSDFDLNELLMAGDYTLVIRRQADSGPVAGYGLTLDARRVASTQPVVTVGPKPAQATRKKIVLKSKKATAVKGAAVVANRGNLPDTLLVRGTKGNGFFKVKYTQGGNITGKVLTGKYSTPVLHDGKKVSIGIVVTPVKKSLIKKNGKTNAILKRARVFTLTATSTFDRKSKSQATIRVETIPEKTNSGKANTGKTPRPGQFLPSIKVK